MPIAFPLIARGRPAIQAKNLVIKRFDVVPAANLGNPNFLFTSETLGSGMGKIYPKANPAALKTSIGKTFAKANVAQRKLLDNKLIKALQGYLNMIMTGISRDSAGAPLGTCQVMIFTTQDKGFVLETTSDASGNWSVSLLKSGPFFLVEYKDGGTPVAGTSLNTLVPVQA